MIFGSYSTTIFFLSATFGIVGGILKVRCHSPLSKVPTSKEEIERIEFEKYYELSQAQLTDLGDIKAITQRIEAIEKELNMKKVYREEEKILIGEERLSKLDNLEIDEEYKQKLRTILTLEAQNRTEEEICVEVGVTKGEVELLKQLLDV